MEERPMAYRWAVLGPERRAWVLKRVERAGFRWTPPPPLPTPRKGVPPLEPHQRLAVLAGWPVKPPVGRRPLPPAARVLKALDGKTVAALHEEAARLGLGKLSAWTDAHIDVHAVHYIVPDPADGQWPDPATGPDRWECCLLVRMVDGEQVRTRLAVLPETFVALPSTVSRRQQRRLAFVTRLVERDTYLWGRDHRPQCGPQTCAHHVDEPEHLDPTA
jgi:hypothetical protein